MAAEGPMDADARAACSLSHNQIVGSAGHSRSIVMQSFNMSWFCFMEKLEDTPQPANLLEAPVLD